MFRTRVILTCLIAALAAPWATTQAQEEAATTPDVVQLDSVTGAIPLATDGGSYFLIDRMNGDGIGLSNGYTRVGLRGKLLDLGDTHLFTELHGLITDQSRLGANLGGGLRTMTGDGVLGLHAWYDHYESTNGNKYQQVALGAEYLHRWMDVRVNGYLPFGERENFGRVLNPGTEVVFFGNSVGTIGVGEYEESLAGFDLEGGVPLPSIDWVRVFGGAYFLNSSKEDIWGVKSRLEARVSQGANLSFLVSDDERFGTSFNVQFQLMFGQGRFPLPLKRDMSGWGRRHDPVQRANTVQLAVETDRVDVPLINTETGRPFQLVWIDNAATASGDGTWENPLASLPGTAQGASHIIVREGSGPTVGGVTLLDGQHLWGEGILHVFHTNRLGAVAIPDSVLRQSGPRPRINSVNPAQPVVTLADGNEVSGFSFGGQGVAIFGESIHDFEIKNVITDADNSLLISDATGRGVLKDSLFRASGLGTAAFISSKSGGRLDLTVSGVETTGGVDGLHIFSQQSVINAEISGFVARNQAGTGLILNQHNGRLVANVVGSQVLNSGGITGRGIELRASNGGLLDVSLKNASVRGNDDLLLVSADSSTVKLDVENSFFTGSANGSGIRINAANATGQFSFTNVTSAGNGEDGFHLAAAGSQIRAVFENSNISQNADDNLDVTAAADASVEVIVNGGAASRTTTGSAFEFFSTGAGSSLQGTFLSTKLNQAGLHAIDGLIDDAGKARIDFRNVQANAAGSHGLNIALTNGGEFVAVIRDSSLTGNGSGSVNINNPPGTVSSINLINTLQ